MADSLWVGKKPLLFIEGGDIFCATIRFNSRFRLLLVQWFTNGLIHVLNNLKQNDKESTKVLELIIWWFLFVYFSTNPIFVRFCKIKEQKNWLGPGRDSNPGPLACEATVLTIQPQPLLMNWQESWKVIPVCLHSYTPNFCQKSNMQPFVSSTLHVEFKLRLCKLRITTW